MGCCTIQYCIPTSPQKFLLKMDELIQTGVKKWFWWIKNIIIKKHSDYIQVFMDVLFSIKVDNIYKNISVYNVFYWTVLQCLLLKHKLFLAHYKWFHQAEN